MISAVLAAAALLFQAAPAADPAPPAAAAVPAPSKSVSGVVVTGKGSGAAAKDGSTVVCRTEKPLGTLFPEKICARRDDLTTRTREDQAEQRRNTALRPWRDPAGGK